MTILYLLIPLGLLLLALAVAAFFWATRTGQFDDLDAPAWRVVMDDDRAPPGPRGEAEDDRQRVDPPRADPPRVDRAGGDRERDEQQGDDLHSGHRHSDGQAPGDRPGDERTRDNRRSGHRNAMTEAARSDD